MVEYKITDKGYDIIVDGVVWLQRTSEFIEGLPGETLEEKAEYDIAHLPDGPEVSTNGIWEETNEEVILYQAPPSIKEKVLMYEEALRLLGVEV